MIHCFYSFKLCLLAKSYVTLILQEYEKHCQKLQSKSLISPSVQSSATRSIHHTDGSPLRVYTDLPHVEEFLTRLEFVISMCCVSLLSTPLCMTSFNQFIFFHTCV